MAIIIAGLFHTREQADRAARRVLALGVPADCVDTFLNNPPGQHGITPVGGDEHADPEARGAGRSAAAGAAAGVGVGGAAGALVAGPPGAAVGAAVGAYLGSLAGGLKGTSEEKHPAAEPRRPAGVVVAIDASGWSRRDALVAALRENGATLVEQADGRWVDGGWADFDPLAPPRPVSTSRAANTSSINEPDTAMKHELPPLPYSLDALEPHISSETLEYHHGKHHRLYVDKLNNLIKGTPFETASLEEIVRKASGQLFNNAAQAWNHNFYWQCLSPDGGGSPDGEVARLMEQGFGGFEQFREKFSQSAETLFGSGWTWLVRNADGSLDIVNTGNAENPMRSGKTPLLACDVWEHAYYIDYRNARKDYVEAFWNVVNWEFVQRNLEPTHAYAHTRS